MLNKIRFANHRVSSVDTSTPSEIWEKPRRSLFSKILEPHLIFFFFNYYYCITHSSLEGLLTYSSLLCENCIFYMTNIFIAHSSNLFSTDFSKSLFKSLFCFPSDFWVVSIPEQEDKCFI